MLHTGDRVPGLADSWQQGRGVSSVLVLVHLHLKEKSIFSLFMSFGRRMPAFPTALSRAVEGGTLEGTNQKSNLKCQFPTLPFLSSPSASPWHLLP